ncbi:MULTISPECIES: GNAT family N-acetyltransferase [Clostridium]|uniref:Acetyltransferase (GNAT) family protein n=2 Tax=Clostridium TaxID=1485 RepID=A0A151AQD6_9CLOT|nr:MULTISPECIES: GNAT family N-acetyltransferase [Clostridium]KYH29617.1 acetyltransferase (GNAT) family protein [Clostridium colicanis DSM 13634]PRR72068.1 Acetyltransferase (GNAT) family protein [Clostridium thermopalmarium DSM 5974]PVZ23721.1 ribosomal protein S18 acetylase RimI-like enzyme [Clostridium thermopalmarium DSM 5974]
MIKKLNLRDIKTAKRVIELQRASYKIEAQLIGFYEIPPLMETIDSLQACDEIFYGYYINDVLAGIISFKIIDNVLDIHRVAIHPTFFRMGIADKLIKFIEALKSNINKILVCTGKENYPAVNLYLKNGYKKKCDIEIKNGVYITEFEKLL